MEKKSVLSMVKKRVENTASEIKALKEDSVEYYENLKKTIILRTEMEIKSQIEIAKALYEIRSKKLYLYDGYKSFSLFLKDYSKGRTQAYRYILVVEGIEKGLIQEQEVLEKGFKFAQRAICDKDDSKSLKSQFLLSFSLNHIDTEKKRSWFTSHKKQIELYLLKEINHRFDDFKKMIEEI